MTRMTEPAPLPKEPSEVAQTLQGVRDELRAERAEEPAGMTGASELPRASSVKLSEPAAMVLDELMTATGVASEDLRSRLIASVDERLAARRRRVGLLEPLLK